MGVARASFRRYGQRSRGLPSPRRSAAARFGRDGDLDELCALVRRERLVSVVGAGGAGKTRLALLTRAFAQTQQRAFA